MTTNNAFNDQHSAALRSTANNTRH